MHEIKLNNLKYDDDIIKKFPIIVALENNKPVDIILYQLNNNEINDYIIIGKFEKNYSLLNNELKIWLELINRLSHYDLINGKIEKYLSDYSCFSLLWLTQSFLFTQEGYDFITGKHNFTKNKSIQRTVVLTDQNEIQFVNDENKVLPGAYFQKFKNYYTEYFLNYQDYQEMNFDDIKTFERINRHRIESFFFEKEKWICKQISENKNFHNDFFILTLLDTILERQQNEKIKKIKKYKI